MDKKEYLRKLSLNVRWRLSAEEAAEVLSDYSELLSRRPDDHNGSLLQALGAPAKAAALLTPPRAYRCWLAAFGTMVLCLLAPLFLLVTRRYQAEPAFLTGCLLIGALLSLLWFRPRFEAVKPPLPKGLLPGLGLLLLLAACSGAILYGLASGAWQSIPAGLYGRIGHGTLRLTGFAAAAAALCGIVKARMAERRWRALYVMGLAVLLESVLVLSLLAGMDMSICAPDWWVAYAARWCILGGVGLAATGASLC